MSRVDVEQVDVFEALVLYLRRALGLNDRQCYETLDPYSPTIPKGGDYWVTVAPGEGQYDVEHQIGGGEDQLTEESVVTVTAYTRIKLDSTDHDENLLRDARRGVFVLKHKILKALVGADIPKGSDTFLRQLLYARHAHAPQILEGSKDNRLRLACISIDFGVDFDWDLT